LNQIRHLAKASIHGGPVSGLVVPAAKVRFRSMQQQRLHHITLPERGRRVERRRPRTIVHFVHLGPVLQQHTDNGLTPAKSRIL
jgi:hypothetical protein